MNYLKFCSVVLIVSSLTGCGFVSDLMVDDKCYAHPDYVKNLPPSEQQKFIKDCGGVLVPQVVKPTNQLQK